MLQFFMLCNAKRSPDPLSMQKTARRPECYFYLNYFDPKQQDMKRQTKNLTHHRDIGGAPTNCRRRRTDHEKIGGDAQELSAAAR